MVSIRLLATCHARFLSRAGLLVWTVAACGWGGCGGRTLDDANPVGVTVTADPAAIEPGGEVTLLWHFMLAADWHLYWSGRNDSGFAPEIELDLPTGWVAGGVQWPTPERLVLPGGILDHVYHHGVTLLQRLGAPTDIRPGTQVAIEARVRWLACKESCVPGKTQLRLTLPVVARADTEPSLELRQAKSRLPQPLPDGIVETGWQGDVFHIRAAESGHTTGTRGLTFMPTLDCGELVDLIADGVGHELALRFVPKAGTVGPVRGLLLIENEFGQTQAFRVDYPAMELVVPDTGG